MNTTPVSADTGMELRELLADREFLARAKRQRPERYDSEAFRSIAHHFASKPGVILQQLVNTATRYCNADSAGISLQETGPDGQEHFRWVAISGSFAGYLNGTTPADFSPCGTTLGSGQAQLYRVTKPYYDFLGIEAEPITDGILIPWEAGIMRGTVWAVSHRSREAFDIDDFNLLKGLADFTAVALRHQAEQEQTHRLESALAGTAMANELAHQINNPLQSVTNALYLAQRGGPDAQGALETASQELTRVTELIKKLLMFTRVS